MEFNVMIILRIHLQQMKIFSSSLSAEKKKLRCLLDTFLSVKSKHGAMKIS